jgi:hypothetical protein
VSGRIAGSFILSQNYILDLRLIYEHNFSLTFMALRRKCKFGHLARECAFMYDENA